MILWYALLLQNSSDITKLIPMKQHVAHAKYLMKSTSMS
jgi:hypothetical protein